METKMSSKKASANMWWIIIGAIIALVVMIVLIVIFTDTTGKAKTGFLDCETKGGECISEESCKSDQNDGRVNPTFSCEKTEEKCCFT
jgi:hypothetical protein